MTTNNSAIHHTITNRSRDNWEFECPTCGYRARYNPHLRHQTQQLKILNVGDPQARHISNHVHVRVADDEAWLTPELRQQMEELLKDVDMGD